MWLLHLFGYVAFMLPVLTGVAAARVFLNRKIDAPRDARVTALITSGFVLTVAGRRWAGESALQHEWRSAVPPVAGCSANFVGHGWPDRSVHRRQPSSCWRCFFAGVTLFTGLSWLKVMDLTGRLSFVLALRAKEGFAALVDYGIGPACEEASGGVTVAEDKKVLEKTRAATHRAGAQADRQERTRGAREAGAAV